MKTLKIALFGAALLSSAVVFAAVALEGNGNMNAASYVTPEGNGAINTASYAAPEGNGAINTASFTAPEGNGAVNTASLEPEGHGQA